MIVKTEVESCKIQRNGCLKDKDEMLRYVD